MDRFTPQRWMDHSWSHRRLQTITTKRKSRRLGRANHHRRNIPCSRCIRRRRHHRHHRHIRYSRRRIRCRRHHLRHRNIRCSRRRIQCRRHRLRHRNIRCSRRRIRCRRHHHLRRSSLRCSSLRCSSLRCSSLRCSSLRCSSLRCSSLRCSSLRCSSLRCSSLRSSRPHRGHSPWEFRRPRRACSSKVSVAPMLPPSRRGVLLRHNSRSESPPSLPPRCNRQLRPPDLRRRRRNVPSCLHRHWTMPYVSMMCAVPATRCARATVS